MTNFIYHQNFKNSYLNNIPNVVYGCFHIFILFSLFVQHSSTVYHYKPRFVYDILLCFCFSPFFGRARVLRYDSSLTLTVASWRLMIYRSRFPRYLFFRQQSASLGEYRSHNERCWKAGRIIFTPTPSIRVLSCRLVSSFTSVPVSTCTPGVLTRQKRLFTKTARQRSEDD